jgi:hypothetical protein
VGGQRRRQGFSMEKAFASEEEFRRRRSLAMMKVLRRRRSTHGTEGFLFFDRVLKGFFFPLLVIYLFIF